MMDGFRPADVAPTLRSGRLPAWLRELGTDWCFQFARRLATAEAVDDLIVMATPDLGELVLLEGHARLTAVFAGGCSRGSRSARMSGGHRRSSGGAASEWGGWSTRRASFLGACTRKLSVSSSATSVQSVRASRSMPTTLLPHPGQ